MGSFGVFGGLWESLGVFGGLWGSFGVFGVFGGLCGSLGGTSVVFSSKELIILSGFEVFSSSSGEVHLQPGQDEADPELRRCETIKVADSQYCESAAFIVSHLRNSGSASSCRG